ncbi:MAG: hypothetical protein GDA45_02790 [Chromatiales bacterium]|nr:hypothetical protein [Chromatiales bacterium]
MKKHVITALAAAAVTLAGCGMPQNQMMMMEEMKSQLNEIQFQVNTNAAAADRAKDMAEEAMIKASTGKSMQMEMMHNKKMMK